MRIFLIMILSGCFLVNAWAQTIVKLKTGAAVEGEIIEKTKDYVKMNVVGTEITYWSDEIESIQGPDSPSQQTTSEDAGPAPQGQQISISGQVVFDGYLQGKIKITAFNSSDRKLRKVIAKTMLDKPGKFTLKLPADTKQIFLSAYNDENNDKKRNKKEPFFLASGSSKNPLVLSGADIDDITLSPSANKN